MQKTIHPHEAILPIDNTASLFPNHYIARVVNQEKRCINCQCIQTGNAVKIKHIDKNIHFEIGSNIFFQVKKLENKIVCRIKDFQSAEEVEKKKKLPWKTGKSYLPKLEESIDGSLAL